MAWMDFGCCSALWHIHRQITTELIKFIYFSVGLLVLSNSVFISLFSPFRKQKKNNISTWGVTSRCHHYYCLGISIISDPPKNWSPRQTSHKKTVAGSYAYFSPFVVRFSRSLIHVMDYRISVWYCWPFCIRKCKSPARLLLYSDSPWMLYSRALAISSRAQPVEKSMPSVILSARNLARNTAREKLMTFIPMHGLQS